MPSPSPLRKGIEEFCENLEVEVLFLPYEYDIAIVGLSEEFNNYRIVYSEEKVLDVLMEYHEMDYESAVEWHEFNIKGGYLGPNAPSFIVDVCHSE